MFHVKVYPTHHGHPQEIHKSPKETQSLEFRFSWGEQYEIVEEGGGSTSILFLPCQLT